MRQKYSVIMVKPAQLRCSLVILLRLMKFSVLLGHLHHLVDLQRREQIGLQHLVRCQKAGAAGVNFTNLTSPLSISVNIAAGATNTSISGTSTGIVPANSTQGELQVSWTPVGAAGADDSITFDNFCLVAGSIVQSYTDLPYDVSLRECKRFFRKSFPSATAPAQNAGELGVLKLVSQAASQVGFYVQFESVELYSTAAITTYNPSGTSSAWLNASSNASVTAGIDFNTSGPKGFLVYTANSVSAANQFIEIHYSADAGL
jgi:hypothetical protein